MKKEVKKFKEVAVKMDDRDVNEALIAAAKKHAPELANAESIKVIVKTSKRGNPTSATVAALCRSTEDADQSQQ